MIREKIFKIFKYLLTVIALAIVAGGSAYLYGSYKFFKNHFGDNVSINGIDVSRMTKEKALTAVNSIGNNWIVLRNGSIYSSHYLDDNDAVNQSNINRYFRQQYSPLGNNKTWNFDLRNLTKDRQKLTKLNKETVIYKINGKSYRLKATELFDTIHCKNGSFVYGDDTQFLKKIDKINSQQGTLYKKYQITVPSGETIEVKNQSYGWAINEAATERAIKRAFNLDQGVVDGAKYIRGTGYNTHGIGYGANNQGIGQNYVVISIKDQKLWVVKDGKPVVTLDDVVTGTTDPAKNDATPTGVWYIMYKQSPSILRGKNDNGTNYASKVNYWMPFTDSGCGLHDASWRTDWSKTAYQKGGSHGCVNIKPSEAKSVWDNVVQNEPVIVY